MKCPVCAVDLHMSERQGIEIDYCPTCRGVWLDRGELDKIIERSKASEGYAQNSEHPYISHNDKKHEYQGKEYSGHKKKKYRSFLEDLFD